MHLHTSSRLKVVEWSTQLSSIILSHGLCLFVIFDTISMFSKCSIMWILEHWKAVARAAAAGNGLDSSVEPGGVFGLEGEEVICTPDKESNITMNNEAVGTFSWVRGSTMKGGMDAMKICGPDLGRVEPTSTRDKISCSLKCVCVISCWFLEFANHIVENRNIYCGYVDKVVKVEFLRSVSLMEDIVMAKECIWQIDSPHVFVVIANTAWSRQLLHLSTVYLNLWLFYSIAAKNCVHFLTYCWHSGIKPLNKQ